MGRLLSYWGIIDKNEDDKCLPKTDKSFDDYNNKYFTNVTNFQIVDGLDEFYSDYRYRRIILHGGEQLG